MTAGAASDEGQGGEVVKWYTRARRFPRLIGKTADGTRIWGGPYTLTQVIVGVAMLILGGKTAWLWGRYGLIANAVILLGLTYAVVLGLGKLPIGARNPLSVLAGALHALSAPSQGRIAGTPARANKPRLTRSRLLISPWPTTSATAAPPLAPGPLIPGQPTSRAERTSRARASAPARSGAGSSQPGVQQLTGVQQLLASAAASSRATTVPANTAGHRAARREN